MSNKLNNNLQFVGKNNFYCYDKIDFLDNSVEEISKIENELENMKEFESAKVSNTAFKIYLSHCNGIAWNDNKYVENSNGTKFYPAHRSDGEISVKEDGTVTYYNTFNLTNYDATDTLKVHLFKVNGDEVIIELVKEK